MIPLLLLSWIALALAPGGLLAGPAPAPGKIKACPGRTVPVSRQVNWLGIYPESRLVAFTFIGEIGRAGGFGAIDYATGAPVDALPAQPDGYVDMKISPSGRLRAFAQTRNGVSALRVSASEGSNSVVCASSPHYYRPLAFSPDERLVAAMESAGRDHRLILCSVSGTQIRSWSTTAAWEHVKESLTPRFHGGPLWTLDSASFSADGKKLLSARTDGQVVVWDISGERLHETSLANFSPGSSHHRLAFAEDGTVFHMAYAASDPSGRTAMVISSLFPEHRRFEVPRESGIKSVTGLDFAYFSATRQGLYLLLLKASAIGVVHVLSGETIAELPAIGSVTALAISHDATTLGVAYAGKLELWNLIPASQDCTD